MRVRLAPSATADLNDIAAWIRRDSPRRALSFVQELRLRCYELGNAPEAFPFVGRYLGMSLRRRAYRGYLLFYRIGETVEVVRILHGARDFDSLLIQ
jgi:plasmid stabilization system protein ParE